MMDKVSRYIVISEETYTDETGQRLRLVYATRTARVMPVLPRVAAALLADDVRSVPDVLLPGLRQAEVIVPAGEDELTAMVTRNRVAASDPSIVQFILLPATYCNMGCAYCGQEHLRGGLSPDHRNKVRARVLRAIRRDTTQEIKVDWFGAEPMMGFAAIRDLAPDFVQAADEVSVKYSSTMVTNGSLLTKRKLDILVGVCRVGNFDITLDGPPDVHDVHRPLKSGQGSFWKIVSTIREALDDPGYQRVNFDFRTNVDIHNQDRLAEYFDLMADLGFARPNVTFSIARVRPWGNDVSAIELSAMEFAERELAWLDTIRRRGLSFSAVPKVAKQVTCPAVRLSGELISGTGNVFSCTDHPLVPEGERDHALGHIADPGLPLFRPAGEFDGWHDEVLAGKSGCRACVFYPTCGGACPKAWREGNPPCPSYKFNIQGRLGYLAAQAGLRPAEKGSSGEASQE
jgi:uncharacterized protein